MLFLYLLTQTVNQEYDTYDSCVVVAKDEISAKSIQPSGRPIAEYEQVGFYNWAPPSEVNSQFIGIAHSDLNDGDVICASFNAG